MISSYVIENTNAAPSVMVRRDDYGKLVETTTEQIPYDVIEEGQYTLEITGFQAPFEMQRPAAYMKDGMDPMVTKTRIEFTVIDGPSEGRAFNCLYTWSLHEKSGLGLLVRAVMQKPIPPRFNVPDILGLTFSAYVSYSVDSKTGQVKTGRDGNPFPEVVARTVKPVQSEPMPSEMKAKKPTPIKPKASVHSDGDNDPTLSFSAFWKFAKAYGYKPTDGIAALEMELGAEPGQFEGMPPGELYNLLAAHVGFEG